MLKRKKSGFTLMEMVIVLGMTVLILGITNTVFITGNKVFSQSDVKTTLQMEAKDIQEKLSDIGMQAVSVNHCNLINDNTDIKDEMYSGDLLKNKFVDINGESELYKEWLNINKIELKSYGKDSEYDSSTDSIENVVTTTFDYSEESKSIELDSKILSNNVTSFRIRPININDENGSISKSSGIEFYIVLSMKKGFTYETYPVNFTVKFRNKFDN